MTSFTRIVVVLSFVRTALGTQPNPPNQVLVGLALLLTFFMMNPVIDDINTNALQPYLANKIIAAGRARESHAAAASVHVQADARERHRAVLHDVEGAASGQASRRADLPARSRRSSISELKTAFEIGFAIYIPFIVIDMVVASVLLSMGMMMIPPVLISLPFKILIFLLVDGWNLTVNALFASFQHERRRQRHAASSTPRLRRDAEAIWSAALLVSPRRR